MLIIIRCNILLSNLFPTPRNNHLTFFLFVFSWWFPPSLQKKNMLSCFFTFGHCSAYITDACLAIIGSAVSQPLSLPWRGHPSGDWPSVCMWFHRSSHQATCPDLASPVAMKGARCQVTQPRCVWALTAPASTFWPAEDRRQSELADAFSLPPAFEGLSQAQYFHKACPKRSFVTEQPATCWETSSVYSWLFMKQWPVQSFITLYLLPFLPCHSFPASLPFPLALAELGLYLPKKCKHLSFASGSVF